MIKIIFKKATLILLLVIAFSFVLLEMGKIESEKPKIPFRVFDEETQRWIMPGHPKYTLWYYGGKDPAKGEEIYQDIVDGTINNVIPGIIEEVDKAAQATLQSDIYKQAIEIIENNTKE